MDRQSTIERIFNGDTKANRSSKRTVEKVVMDGLSVGVYVKDRTSDSEIDITTFLGNLGISEKAITYDDKKVVFKEVAGVEFDEYVFGFNSLEMAVIKNSNKKNGSTKFLIESIQPELSNLAQSDAEAAMFCSKMIGREIFQLAFGIFHNDIKSGNIIVNKKTNEPVFVDFGEAEVVGMKMEENRTRSLYYRNLLATLGLLSCFADEIRDSQELMKVKISVHDTDSFGFKVFSKLYKDYVGINLSDRKKIVESVLVDSTFGEILEVWGIPSNIRSGAMEEFKKLVKSVDDRPEL